MTCTELCRPLIHKLHSSINSCKAGNRNCGCRVMPCHRRFAPCRAGGVAYHSRVQARPIYVSGVLGPELRVYH